MCRADLNFEGDFGSNDAIGTVTTWWELILLNIHFPPELEYSAFKKL